MRLSDRLRESFVAGLILVAPLLVTLYVVRILVNWTFGIVNPIVVETRLAQYTANVELVAQILAVALLLLVVVILGYLTRWSIAHRTFGNLGRAINFVPLVSTIYSSVRQVATALVSGESQYESVVLVEYPREGLYSIGLVTAEGIEDVDAVTGVQSVSVFLPNSPNPTAGRLVMVPEDQVHQTDMSVRQGMRMIVTTGIGMDEPDAMAADAIDEGGRPTPGIEQPAGDPGDGDATDRSA